MPKILRFVMLSALLAVLCLAALAQSHVVRGTVKSASASAPAKPVDINGASLDELLRIPGMTRVWAARIVRYRPYRSKLELEEHGIVSEEVYERIKDFVVAHREEK